MRLTEYRNRAWVVQPDHGESYITNDLIYAHYALGYRDIWRNQPGFGYPEGCYGLSNALMRLRVSIIC